MLFFVLRGGGGLLKSARFLANRLIKRKSSIQNSKFNKMESKKNPITGVWEWWFLSQFLVLICRRIIYSFISLLLKVIMINLIWLLMLSISSHLFFLSPFWGVFDCIELKFLHTVAVGISIKLIILFCIPPMAK